MWVKSLFVLFCMNLLCLLQINLSYCSVTDVGLLALARISWLQNMTILHLSGLSPNGLAAALLACGGLKKVKLHTSFKALLHPSLLEHMESRGCVFQWRDKPFQPQVTLLFSFPLPLTLFSWFKPSHQVLSCPVFEFLPKHYPKIRNCLCGGNNLKINIL